MLRGEAISWLYTLALLDALYMVEADLQTKSAEELTTGRLRIAVAVSKLMLSCE